MELDPLPQRERYCLEVIGDIVFGGQAWFDDAINIGFQNGVHEYIGEYTAQEADRVGYPADAGSGADGVSYF